MLRQEDAQVSDLQTIRIDWLKQAVLPAVVTVGIVVLLMQIVEPEAIFQGFRSLDWSFVAAGLCFYIGSYVFRAWRLQQFDVLRGTPFLLLLHIIVLYNFFNYLLPARSGELTLIYFLRRYQSIPTGQSIGILILLRLFELSSMLLCLLAALFYYQFIRPPSTSNPILTDGLALVIVGVLAVTSLILTVSIRPVSKILLEFWNRNSAENPFWQKKIFRTIRRWAEEVGEVADSSATMHLFSRLFLLSVLMWGCLFGMFWSLLMAMNYHSIALDEIVIGSIGPILTNLLPINSVGNFGTLQVGWAASFALVGMSVEDSITSSVVVNVWVVTYVICLTIVSSVITRFSRRKRVPMKSE